MRPTSPKSSTLLNVLSPDLHNLCFLLHPPAEVCHELLCVAGGSEKFSIVPDHVLFDDDGSRYGPHLPKQPWIGIIGIICASYNRWSFVSTTFTTEKVPVEATVTGFISSLPVKKVRD